jgi:Ca2+-binding EF-hand superfamily protein
VVSQVSTPKFERKFRQLDLDNSGYLDHKEVTELCRWINVSFSTTGEFQMTAEQIDKETTRLIKRIDKNGDGHISMSEFKDHYEARAAKAAK